MGILKDKFALVALPVATEVKDMVKEYADLDMGTITLGQLYGGQKSMKALVTETSLLDPEEGIRFRGKTVRQRLILPTNYNSLCTDPRLPGSASQGSWWRRTPSRRPLLASLDWRSPI